MLHLPDDCAQNGLPTPIGADDEVALMTTGGLGLPFDSFAPDGREDGMPLALLLLCLPFRLTGLHAGSPPPFANFHWG